MSTTTQRYSNQLYSDTERLASYCHSALSRKRVCYWLGFLEGMLASGKIESGEPIALAAEASRFIEFFDDPDAIDLVSDVTSGCFSSADDLLVAIEDVAEVKRAQTIDGELNAPVDEINQFLGFCAGIICDGRVLAREVQQIRNRFQSSVVLTTNASFRQLRKAVDAAFSDDFVSENECSEIAEWLGRLVGDGYADTGIANIGNVTSLDKIVRDHRALEFSQRKFVLTGPMRLGTRSYIVSLIERAGGIFDSRPTKHTSYVIVATTASNLWVIPSPLEPDSTRGIPKAAVI